MYIGLMSAEGLLADPCLFFRKKVYDHVHGDSAPNDNINNDDIYSGISSTDDDQNEGRVSGSNSNFERQFETGFISNNTESNIVDGDCRNYDNNSSVKESHNKKMRLSNTETKLHSTEYKDYIKTNTNDGIDKYDDGSTKVNDIIVHSPVNHTLGDVESAVINNTKNSIYNINQTLITPDRAYLFEEYCHLSDLFFLAGGWRGLQTRDLDFPEKTYDNDAINNRDFDKNSNNDTNDENKKKDSNDIPNNGHTKQMEIARQHLNFMLEKRGHGGSVRYNHMGPYKRHTDLLNEIKNSTSIQQLVLISKLCLRNVYETKFHNDYD
jgi:hypothetical protein